VALSLEQGESAGVTHAALHQALQAAGLTVALEAETLRQLQDPAAILALKQAAGGPGRQALDMELAQLDAFVAAQQQAWQTRKALLQAKYAACRQLA
jgi:hypothetical protein